MAVIAGGGTAGTEAAALSGGSSGRDFFDLIYTVTENASAESLDIRIGSSNPNANVKVKFWRPSGGDYVFIGESQVFTGLSGTTTGNTFTTPIDVQTGDIVSLWIGAANGGRIGVETESPNPTEWSGSDSDYTATISQSVIDTALPNRRMFFAINGTPAASDTLTITTPQYRFWQRSPDSANVTIEGTYTGSPTSIERNVNGGGWVSAIAAPSGGTFSDTFSLPTGQHSIQYRFSNDVSVTDTVNNIAVGDVFALSGQSNMSGRGTNNQTFSNSAGGTTAYLLGNDDQYKQLSDPSDSNTVQVDSVSSDASAGGSWAVRFAHHWLASSDVPVCLIPCAKGGSTIADWSRSTLATTLYGSMKRRIDAVGGVKAVFFQQGEADSNDANGTLATTYQAALEQLANDINTDFGVDTFVVPLHVITATGYDGNGTTTGQNAIRQAQIDAAAANPNITIGMPNTDFDLSGGDGIHLQTDADLDVLGLRVFNNYFHPKYIASVSFDGLLPTFSVNGATVAPVFEASIAFNGLQPQFSAQAFTVDPGANSAVVSFNGLEPSFSASASATIPSQTASVSFDGIQPSFSVTANTTDSGSVATVNFNGLTPSFSASASTSNPNGSAAVSMQGLQPTFSVLVGPILEGYPTKLIKITNTYSLIKH